MNLLTKKLSKTDLLGVVVLSAVILVLFPAVFSIFRLNLIGKYLTYAFVGVSLVLLWGNGGILSLGQGVFFGLGGYCMAMFLKLEASDPIATKIQTTPGIPDFMDWNQITQLPLFWMPFKSLTFTILAILIIPAFFAFIIGVAMFKRRVGGVYFAIITQAVALILSVLIVGQQGLTGGINGITDLKTMHGWDIRTDSAKYILYYVNGVLLIGCVVFTRWVLSTKFGMLLLGASREGGSRALLRLRRGQFQDARLLHVGRDVRHRRRDVHAAGRLHVTLVRRHHALDRDGDLHRGRRAHVGGRRGLRHAAGELRQDLLLRTVSGFVAVLDGRARSSAWCCLFPDGLAGLYERYGKPFVARLTRARRHRRRTTNRR